MALLSQKPIMIILALYTFLTTICTSWSLSFTPLSQGAIYKPLNTSINTAKLFPFLPEYDILDTLTLNKRQEEECPPGSPIQCPDGIHCTTPEYDVCCPDGTNSCPTGASCCNEGTHCTPVGGFCCGDTACNDGYECCPGGCGPPGSTCCGPTRYCDKGKTCCGEGRCADEGSTCCGTTHQCAADEQCCSEESGGCAPKDATCCGPEIHCKPGSICCIDKDNDYFCSPGPKCIDTLYLDLNDYPGQDEIFENMCRGILQSPLFDPENPNEIKLTYNGRNQNALASQNRRDSGCAGSPCARIFSELGPTGKRIRWSCDEFPFASSAEGGSDAAIICVPQSINSAIGSRWRWAVRGKSPKTQIRVKIKGVDCSKTIVDKKRSVRPGNMVTRAPTKGGGAVLKNDTDVIYVDGSVYANKTDGSVAMLIPFYIPDNFTGTFNVNYNIASGTLKSGSLVDDWGNYYGSVPILDSGKSASGTIDVGPYGVGDVMMFAWADNTEVSVKYTTSLTTSTTTPKPTEPPGTATASAPATTTNGASRNHGGMSFWIVYLVAAVLRT